MQRSVWRKNSALAAGKRKSLPHVLPPAWAAVPAGNKAAGKAAADRGSRFVAVRKAAADRGSCFAAVRKAAAGRGSHSVAVHKAAGRDSHFAVVDLAAAECYCFVVVSVDP